MTKIYRNVVIWDASSARARKCDLLTGGGKIISVLPPGSGAAADESFDGKGRTAIIPGFINTHTHIAMSVLRGLGEDLPLMDWLQQKIWPVEAKLTAEITGTATNIGMMEMLSAGTTSFIDMYFFTRDIADAALAAGMRCNVTRAVAGEDRGEAMLAESLEIAGDYDGAEGLVRVSVGPHAVYTVKEDLMRKCVEAAIGRKLNIHFHFLETDFERDYFENTVGMSPADYLDKLGFLEAEHLLLAHCVRVGEDEAAFYARPNVTVAHNPKSNLKLASGVANVPEMLAAGVNVGLGTDGAASNNRLDLWDEMRFAALLHKGVKKSPTIVSAHQALTMATAAGAAALGFDGLGLLAEGYIADIVLIDLDQPHYIGWNEENLAAFIVYAGSSRDVAATVVAGKTLYERGEFKTIDKSRILAAAEKSRRYLAGDQ